MGKLVSMILLSATACLACLPAAMAAEEAPAWAYPVNPPDFKPAPDDGSIRRVPGSTAGYTLAQERDLFLAGLDSGKASACATCHGKDLRGADAIPSIAGRSPTCVFRQLHELQTGARAGPGAQPMKAIVARISQAEMIAIAAYLGTLEP